MPFSRISAIREDVNDGFRSGLRASARIAPTDNLTITPRIVYQRVKMDGWNRFDEFNILANPYTTTRPAVTLGERRQFTQLQEDFTDDFVVVDANVNYQMRNFALTSVTSYLYRDILVVRDAGALTSSITGGSIGLPENVYTLDAPLNDATTADVWTQEVRVAGGKDRFPMGGRRVLQPHGPRLRPGPPGARVRGAERHPDHGAPRSEGHVVLFRFELQHQSVRALRRGDVLVHTAIQRDGRTALLPFQRRQRTGF